MRISWALGVVLAMVVAALVFHDRYAVGTGFLLLVGYGSGLLVGHLAEKGWR